MAEIKENTINVICKKIIKEDGTERAFLSYENQEELVKLILEEIQADIIDYVTENSNMSLDEMVKIASVLNGTVRLIRMLGADQVEKNHS